MRVHSKAVQSEASADHIPSAHVVVFEEADIPLVVSMIAALPDLTVEEGFVHEDLLNHSSMRLVATVCAPSPGKDPRSVGVEIVVQPVVASAWSEAEPRFRYNGSLA